jgi:hypothetical protein
MHSLVKFDLTGFCYAIEILLGNSNAGGTNVEPTLLLVHPWPMTVSSWNGIFKYTTVAISE